MANKESLRNQFEIIAGFPTQESAQQASDLLKEEGLSSSESLVKTLEAASETTVSQVKTQRNIGKGIVVGGTFGALLGFIGCLARLRVSGNPIFSNDSAFTTLSVSLAIGLIKAICSSLTGVISASSIPPKPLLSIPKTPSHRFLVSVKGNLSGLAQQSNLPKKKYSFNL